MKKVKPTELFFSICLFSSVKKLGTSDLQSLAIYCAVKKSNTVLRATEVATSSYIFFPRD